MELPIVFLILKRQIVYIIIIVLFQVLTCALPYNSPYKIPVARMNGVLCRTNSPSNTAFRGFGHPQKLFYMETIMRAISHKLGLSVDKVKYIKLEYKQEFNRCVPNHLHCMSICEHQIETEWVCTQNIKHHLSYRSPCKSRLL